MDQKELNDEYKEIKNKAYELYEKHGFKDGNDFVDWLEAERQMEKQPRLKRREQIKNILLAIVGILSLIVIILLIMLFRRSSNIELSKKSLSDMKVMMLVLDKDKDEEVVAFGDTHFDYNNATLTSQAKALLGKEVQTMKNNPKIKVRMAGYTSAKGTEQSNQILSEKRANAVRNYLIEQGIEPERITTIGYGRTKPALYEVSPAVVDSEEAKANMRVLFEIIMK